jgi:hypothetical protein
MLLQPVRSVRQVVGLDAVNAEALCGQDALRLWELGGMPGHNLTLAAGRLWLGGTYCSSV